VICLLLFLGVTYFFSVFLLFFLFRDEAVDHALKIRKSVHNDNYHNFFQLYKNTPNMGVCILDLLIDSMRLKALQRMLKAYRPVGVSLSFVLEELAYSETEDVGIQFMKKLGCIIQEKQISTTSLADNNADGDNTGGPERIWNTKDTNIDPAALYTEEKLLL
jgi:hypothetical protein